MVPSVTTVLQRFKTDWAAQLQPEAIHAACEAVGYTAWRDRLLNPVITVQLFLLQILHGNTACRHLSHLPSFYFSWWHRVRDGTLTHASFASYMWPVRREVEHLLNAGQSCGVPKTEGMCREILKLRRALWTFVRHEGVEPTNNAAERAIRPGVLWRKRSFGTQSPAG